jgi:hypothetical protein
MFIIRLDENKMDENIQLSKLWMKSLYLNKIKPKKIETF